MFSLRASASIDASPLNDLQRIAMMMMSHRSVLSAAGALFLAAALMSACSADHLSAPAIGPHPTDATASQGGSESDSTDPHFLTADSSAPTIANPVIAFWAKKGRDTTVTMLYHARPGHNDSTKFMRFRVRSNSLVSRPDGTLIAKGDSILITVTLIDPVALKLDFQPSGLQFSSHDPAELKMSFAETVPIDSLNLQALKIWRRESALDPWLPLSSVIVVELNEVQASIGGFTGYALAY
jgi:hypothetical protein